MTILMYAIGVFVASLLTIFMVYGTSDGTDGSIETSEQVKIMTTQEKIDFILMKQLPKIV